MALPRHQELILQCCRVESDPEQRRRIAALLDPPTEIDLSRLVAEARHLEVAPLVRHTLRQLPAGLLPPSTIHHLDQLYYANLGRNFFLSRELRALIQTLTEGGVAVIPLKGVLLAETVYGNLALRRMGDLDVLVRRRDVVRAVGLLREAGFHAMGPVPRAESEDGFLRSNRDVSLKKETGPAGVVLELHWKLKDRLYSLPEETLWTSLREYDWSGQPVELFTPELTLLHLIHHLNYHAYPLKFLVDVAECIARYQEEMDWDQVAYWARGWGLGHSLALALGCIERALERSLPPAVLHGLSRPPRARRWHPSLVARKKWFFSRRGSVVRSDPYLGALFSVLAFDRSLWAGLRVLILGRSENGAQDAAARKPTGTGRARRLWRGLAGLSRGFLRFCRPPPRVGLG